MDVLRCIVSLSYKMQTLGNSYQHAVVLKVNAEWCLESEDNIYRTLCAGNRNHCNHTQATVVCLQLYRLSCCFNRWPIPEYFISCCNRQGWEWVSTKTADGNLLSAIPLVDTHTFTFQFFVIHQGCMCKHNQTQGCVFSLWCHWTMEISEIVSSSSDD